MYSATAWFVDIFISNQPSFELLLRIWDVFLNEGQKFVMRFALSVLKKEEKRLLKLDMGECIMHLSEVWANMDPDEMIEGACKLSLTHSTLNKLEKDYKKMLPEQIDQLPF